MHFGENVQNDINKYTKQNGESVREKKIPAKYVKNTANIHTCEPCGKDREKKLRNEGKSESGCV